MKYYIYGIEGSNGVYYIGRTKNIAQRKRQHKYLGRTGTFMVLAECLEEDAKELERYYIAKYRDSLENKRERHYTGVSVRDIQLNR